ncbi:MAG: long-chain-fatty-acid--CoA ligase, partial [Acidimicrobiales bacterium]
VTGLRTVSAMLRYWAEVTPDAPMLTCRMTTLSWSQVYRRAKQIARSLASEGIEAGDRVAFLDRNGIEYFEVLFGCALIGAVCVAVNWRLSSAEMAAVVDDCGASILFVGAEYAGEAAPLGSILSHPAVVVPLDDLADWRAAGAGSEDDPGFEPTGDDVVLQLYTSGTTGLPKGAMLSASNLSCILSEAEAVFRIGPDTVSLVAMPLFHIGGSGWALCGMSQGGHTVIVRDVDPAEILSLIQTHRVTETFVVPAVLLYLLGTPQLAVTDVSSLRTIFYGASPITQETLVRSMKAFGCDFAQVYGLTETTGAITSLMPEDHDPSGSRSHLLRSAGRPFDHVEVAIIDPETCRPVAEGVVGEVWTRSEQNMLGYWKKPVETSSVLSEDGWFRTGDAGWIDADGYLFLHDRIKDMVVTGGENVYPAEVENVLADHPWVADVAVIGIPDDLWGESVMAVVVRADGAPDDDSVASDIVDMSRERLAHYKCPSSVVFVDSLPRNPSGKVLKRELRAPYWKGVERSIH